MSKGNFNTEVDWKRLQMQTLFGTHFCVWMENNEDLSTTEMTIEDILGILLKSWKSQGYRSGGEKIHNPVKVKQSKQQHQPQQQQQTQPQKKKKAKIKQCAWVKQNSNRGSFENMFTMDQRKWKIGAVSCNKEFSPASIIYRHIKINVKAEVSEPLSAVVKNQPVLSDL